MNTFTHGLFYRNSSMEEWKKAVPDGDVRKRLMAGGSVLRFDDGKTVSFASKLAEECATESCQRL